jgi:gliding motility-associated-like protein
MPNAFSPNKDGINDFIKPFIACDLTPENYSFSIFNSSGHLLFSTTAYDIGWDGSYNNTMQEIGVYLYFVSYTNPKTHINELHKGDFSLIK